MTVVRTDTGDYAATVAGGVVVLKGVRYAAGTGGARRFRPPERPDPHAGVRPAREFAPSCPQPTPARGAMARRLLGIPVAEAAQSEDCLALNVWAPEGARAAPVLVWFHAGLSTGSGSWPWYDGEHLARSHGIAVVTVNVRIGAFGHLDVSDVLGPAYDTAANCGVLDSVAALDWVARNAASFGGDATNVTIGGSCAGAARVHALLATRAADPLYARAIVQSRQGPDATSRDDAVRAARSAWPDGAGSAVDVPAADLVEAVARSGVRLGPVIDGDLLTGSFFETARTVPILVGVNRDEIVPPDRTVTTWAGATETDLLARLRPVVGSRAEELVARHRERRPDAARWDVYRDVLGTYLCVEPTMRVAARNAAAGAPTFAYRLEWTTTMLDARPRTPHGVDVPFALGNTRHCPIAARDPGSEPLGAAMSEAWAAFVRDGRPAAAALPAWPDHGEPGAPRLVLGHDPRVVHAATMEPTAT